MCPSAARRFSLIGIVSPELYGIMNITLTADERVKNVLFTEDSISVDLMDGRTISAPLLWYPKLFHATANQLAN